MAASNSRIVSAIGATPGKIFDGLSEPSRQAHGALKPGRRNKPWLKVPSRSQAAIERASDSAERCENPFETNEGSIKALSLKDGTRVADWPTIQTP